MGRILIARDVRLGREVALKELLASDAHLAARFEREARITANLGHPGIVSVHEAGTWPSGAPYYVMRLVTGRPLDQVIAGLDDLPARLALLPNLIAVADALAYAHARRIIHRDLKPGNVLLGEYGDTVVIDWGLARELDTPEPAGAPPAPARPPKPGATVAGEVMGTPAYMPPEQARGEAVDQRADVYALGAMLYHLLAGRTPYRARSVEDALQQVILGPPRALAELAPEAPPDLVTVVAKAMAREPADRYRDAGELAAELKRFQTGQLVGAHRYSTGQLVRRFLARHRAGVVAAAIALVAVAAIATYSIRRIVRSRDAELASRLRAERNEALAEARADAALLAQAESELGRDPTRTVTLLAGLREGSPRWPEARVLAADALSRGVARRRWRLPEGSFAALAAGARPGGPWVALSEQTVWLVRPGQTPTAVPGVPFVRELALTGDGRFVVGTGDSVGTIELADPRWQATPVTTTPCDDARFGGPFLGVSAVASAGPLTLWSPGPGCTTMLGEPGQPPRVLLGEAVHALAIAPDGHRVAASISGAVIVTDLQGSVLARRPTQRPARVAFDHSGRWVALADGLTGQLIDLEAPERVIDVPELSDARPLLGGESGRFFGQVLNRKVLTLFSAEVQTTLRLPESRFDALTLSADGRWLAYADDENRIAVVDLATLSPRARQPASVDMRTLMGHATRIRALAFRSDSTGLLSASEDGEVREWSLDAPILPRPGLLDDGAHVHVEVAAAGELAIFDLATRTTRQLAAPGARTLNALSPQGGYALVETDGDDRLVALGDGRVVLEVPPLGAGPEIAFAPDEHEVVIRVDGALRRFELPSGRALEDEPPSADSFIWVGTRLVFEDDSGLWVVEPGAARRRLADPAGAHGWAASSDGCCLALLGERSATIWDVTTGSHREVTLPPRADELLLSPSGLLAVSHPGGVLLADRHGQRELVGPRGGHDLTWSRDGALLAMSAQGGVWVWDLATGRGRMATPPGAAASSQVVAGDGGFWAAGRVLRLLVDDLPREPRALATFLHAVTE